MVKKNMSFLKEVRLKADFYTKRILEIVGQMNTHGVNRDKVVRCTSRRIAARGYLVIDDARWLD